MEPQSAEFELIPRYHFWRQRNYRKVAYDSRYVSEKSHTKQDLAVLRLGWLSAHLGYENLRRMRGVDIGCGNGNFGRCADGILGSIHNYDVVLSGATISRRELDDTAWDIVFLFDVLEHFDDIDSLFDLKWRYAMVSFPETPKVCDYNELKSWRHYKPGEHLWMLNEVGCKNWFINHGCHAIASSCFEDAYRVRWDPDVRNITTMLVERPSK